MLSLLSLRAAALAVGCVLETLPHASPPTWAVLHGGVSLGRLSLIHGEESGGWWSWAASPDHWPGRVLWSVEEAQAIWGTMGAQGPSGACPLGA